MTAQSHHNAGGNPESSSAASGQDAVRASEKLIADATSIPDGPNVAPSPLEHLAAQGKVAAPAPSNTAGTARTGVESSAGKEPVEPVAPSEQPLVDEQLARDSAASEKTSPPPSDAKPGGQQSA